MPVANDAHQADAATGVKPAAENGSAKTEQSEGRSLEKSRFSSNTARQGKSMAERRKIPYSFYLTLVSTLGLQLCSGMIHPSTVESLAQSISIATLKIKEALAYTKDLSNSLFLEPEHRRPISEYMFAALSTTCIMSVFYVLFIAPFLGGFWTGAKSRKHLVHRYMGLFYLTQYGLAWVEFALNYETAQHSVLPATIATNGLIQAWSAFFSFKVLPELNDAGYYSDKSVLSRSFVHENAFFTLMAVFGAIYYNDAFRANLRTSLFGLILEYVFLFWPYILVRPLFPITRFKDAGSTHKGRTEQNQRFYEIGTYMVKIFFLYAKYFLGFYVNFLIFLELPTRDDWKLLNGCLLLNIGTVSIAVFLHTLRFKKILPPRLTFGLYLAQIYATVAGIPYAYHVFTAHPKLLAVCFAGLLCNMTRSRKIHAVWCFAAMCLLSNKSIEW